jgi:hypothetical protein
MNRFIAYFDYLGFKDFIENNDLDYQKQIVGNNFRDMELALSNGQTKNMPSGRYIADISESKINCINFSDTIVFWTNDDSEASLQELLQVAHKFNWQAIDFFFPVRGAVVYGELEYVGYKQHNDGGGLYNINSVYGKGLVKAHLKAEIQNWAGTVLDESLVDELSKRDLDVDVYLEGFAKKYKVPYKNGIDLPEEYVFRIISGSLNDEALKNYRNGIVENFGRHKKSLDHPGAKEKLANTINFLESFHENQGIG